MLEAREWLAAASSLIIGSLGLSRVVVEGFQVESSWTCASFPLDSLWTSLLCLAIARRNRRPFRTPLLQLYPLQTYNMARHPTALTVACAWCRCGAAGPVAGWDRRRFYGKMTWSPTSWRIPRLSKLPLKMQSLKMQSNWCSLYMECTCLWILHQPPTSQARRTARRSCHPPCAPFKSLAETAVTLHVAIFCSLRSLNSSPRVRQGSVKTNVWTHVNCAWPKWSPFPGHIYTECFYELL